MQVAINGFGRIGRLSLRYLLKNKDVQIVAINDLTDNDTLARLFKYDSAQGIFPGKVTATDNQLIIGNHKLAALSERDPAKLPWKKLKVDVVLECTGVFRTGKQASRHIKAGAKKVVISAPAKSDDIKTIVIGVNEQDLSTSDKIISNASCTTNCLAPVVKILDQNWGITMGAMTTTHAYTADQRLQDSPHRDPRRARAAAVNIVPTSTGAATAVAKVYPQIEDKISAIAIRVPVITGSMVELNVVVDKPATAEQVNAKFREASRGKMRGILQYSEDPLVSSDIIGNTYSSIFDSMLTGAKGNMIKVVSWYDNEAGYASRMADLTTMVGRPSGAGKRRK
ncbi:MAG: type I glyceraldehyde-3-phosphate dehydrogenase [bacterium]